MGLYDDVKHFIKKHTYSSNQLIKLKSARESRYGHPLTIKYKFRLNAKEITTDQSVINSIVKKIIKKDYSKRSFAGKKDNDIKVYHGRIYQYESYRTQNVKLIPDEHNKLGVFVGETFLEKLPEEYNSDVLHYLQTSIFMAFAYVTGGPYKQFNEQTHKLEEGFEPFDLTLYVQFS